ncbi:MAG: fibronectin type III domain-containing protein [Acidimicrobiaceae bacterium]|nr:fibronectin type III domain-containing protein [Acidimicrobiaceae bacterium]
MLAFALLAVPPAGPALAQSGSETGPGIASGPAMASSPAVGDAYGAGERVVVALTFDEAVSVSGQPRLGVIVGEQRRWAKYDRRASGGAVLHFAYEVRPADRDDDGIRIKKNSLRLNGAAIADAGGNPASLEHRSLPSQAGHQVDGSAQQPQQQQPDPEPTQPEPTQPEPQQQPEPTTPPVIVDEAPSVTGGPILNSPRSGGVYGSGEQIAVSLTFSEPVTVSGTPRLGVVVGKHRRWAGYDPQASSGATLVFAYTVRAADRDNDGIKIKKNALRLNRGSIADASGNAAKLKHPAVATLPSHKVDGAAAPAVSVAAQTTEPEPPAPPTVTGIAITSTPEAGGTYRSKATPRTVTYCAGEATLTVRGTQKVFKTVTSPPCGTGQTETTVTTALKDVTHEKIQATVTFDEKVTVTTGAVAGTDVPFLRLDIGGILVAAGYTAGTGTADLVFEYTIGQRDADADGVSIPENPIVLLGGASAIQGSTGLDAVTDHSGLGDQASHKVDGAIPQTPVTGGSTTPMIEKVSIASTPAKGTTYGAGEHIDVAVKWSEIVRGLNHPYPTLKLTVGNNTRTALMATHRGDTSTFRYAVQSDDATAGGLSVSVSVPQDPLTVPNGVSIRNLHNSKDAVTSYAGLAAAQSGYEVNGSVDNIAAPQPTGLSATGRSGWRTIFGPGCRGNPDCRARYEEEAWADLRWQRSHDTTITAYQYRLKPAGGDWGDWTVMAPFDGAAMSSYRITGLTKRAEYKVKIRAADKNGPPAESAEAAVSWNTR